MRAPSGHEENNYADKMKARSGQEEDNIKATMGTGEILRQTQKSASHYFNIRFVFWSPVWPQVLSQLFLNFCRNLSSILCLSCLAFYSPENESHGGQPCRLRMSLLPLPLLLDNSPV